MIPAAHVIFVLDDSGSMAGAAVQTRRAFEAMTETLQMCKGAEIVFTLIKFGDKPRTVFTRRHIQEVERIWYRPNNNDDSIYDSVKAAIELGENSPRDEKVIVILQADGGDTCSRNGPDDVRPLVEAKQAAGWEFLFLGAAYYCNAACEGCDCQWFQRCSGSEATVYKCAEWLGIPKENVILYNPYEGNISLTAFEETAVNIGSVASRLTEHASYTEEQRKKASG